MRLHSAVHVDVDAQSSSIFVIRQQVATVCSRVEVLSFLCI